MHACAQELADDKLPPGWLLVQSSSHARVAHNPQEQLYYKEFLPRSPAESLKALLRGSRAKRARINSDALLRAGFDAPANIAWGKLGGGREYLFSTMVPGDGISQWLSYTLTERHGQQLVLRRRLLSDLGTCIGRLHATGFVHGDLRPGNVLVSLQGEHFHCALIDNERTVRMTPPSGRQLLRNLMQLNMLLPTDLSRTDRMRFFRAWHRQMRDLSRLEAALLATDAYQWAMRRLDEKGLL